MNFQALTKVMAAFLLTLVLFGCGDGNGNNPANESANCVWGVDCSNDIGLCIVGETCTNMFRARIVRERLSLEEYVRGNPAINLIPKSHTAKSSTYAMVKHIALLRCVLTVKRGWRKI